jgi:hypothetical protein
MRRIAILIAAAAVATTFFATPALAAKGKPSGGGGATATFQLQVLSGPDQVPNWNEQVTFNVHQTATTEPHVDLTCTQNGAVVLGATTGFYDSYPWPWTQVMTLSSNSWTGGAADCSARLYYFDGRRTTTIQTLTFLAGA